MFYTLSHMRTASLGELEFLVLFTVGGLGADAYGAEVRRDVSARRARDYSVGAIYATLQRLEDKGLVSSAESDPLPIRGGRSRRCFRLTSSGRSILRKSVESRRRFWKALDLDWTPS
jgi:DNA-binding PadR family transcriptional regulator